MNKHFELIKKYCEVIEIVGENAIFYKDKGRGYAEINGAPFLCNSKEEFHDLLELFGDEDFSE